MSCGTLLQQKLKTCRLASTGSGRSAVSWFAGGPRSAAALEVDNCRQRQQPRGSAGRPSEPSITGARWQPILSLPRLTFIFLSHLPSLSLPVSSHQPPLCDAQGGILQLLSAYCLGTRAKSARTHIRKSAHNAHRHECTGLKLAQTSRQGVRPLALSENVATALALALIKWVHGVKSAWREASTEWKAVAALC